VDGFLPFFRTAFLYIIDKFITGPTARTQQFAFEAVALKAVTFEAVAVKAVTFEAVAFKAVTYIAVPP
jgi:hypothetical protein